jgi:hypothetical protein
MVYDASSLEGGTGSMDFVVCDPPPFTEGEEKSAKIEEYKRRRRRVECLPSLCC